MNSKNSMIKSLTDKKIEILKYLLAFVAVMLIGARLIAFQGEDPVKALSAILTGALGSKIAIGNTIRWIIPCVMTGMAAVVAFKSGVNNLGIEGQIYFGGFAAALAGYCLNFPPVINVVVCLLIGGLSGLLYALIPAILKLFFRIDEMITTLMFNYIAILLTEYFTVLVIGASSSTASNALQTPATAMMETAAEHGKKMKVYIPESRALDGGRPFVKDALRLGHSPVFFPDAAMASFVKKTDIAFVGAETFFPDGSTANTAGSDLVAMLCFLFQKPFFVPTAMIKVNITGIEGHSKKELGRDLKEHIAVGWEEETKNKTDFICPDLSIVEPKYITGYITELGVIPPAAMFGVSREYIRSVEG